VGIFPGGRRSRCGSGPALPRLRESSKCLLAARDPRRLASARRSRFPGSSHRGRRPALLLLADGSRHTGDADLPLFLAVPQSRGLLVSSIAAGISGDPRPSSNAMVMPSASGASARASGQPLADSGAVPSEQQMRSDIEHDPRQRRLCRHAAQRVPSFGRFRGGGSPAPAAWSGR
jgi:hypothetical protein